MSNFTDHSEWSEGAKHFIITANVFTDRNSAKQLTAGTVLTFIMEKHNKVLSTKINDFFRFKHNLLKKTITGATEKGPFYSDDLVKSIHESLKEDTGDMSMATFTSSLIKRCGGTLSEPLQEDHFYINKSNSTC